MKIKNKFIFFVTNENTKKRLIKNLQKSKVSFK